jgi:hypothetical protein
VVFEHTAHRFRDEAHRGAGLEEETHFFREKAGHVAFDEELACGAFPLFFLLQAPIEFFEASELGDDIADELVSNAFDDRRIVRFENEPGNRAVAECITESKRDDVLELQSRLKGRAEVLLTLFRNFVK